uniref:Aminopeptidase n=1 Tax=Strigamia maritima TaxID=126957 RepID=T1IVB3_STRMM
MASIHITVLLHLAFVCVWMYPACPRLTKGYNFRSERSVSKARLPSSIAPIHYTLEIQPFPNNDTFQGMVSIILHAEAPSSNITLHSMHLKIQETQLQLPMNSNEHLAVPNVKRLSHDDESQQLILELDQGLNAGIDYELKMRFSGQLSSDFQGLYKAIYKDSNGTERFEDEVKCIEVRCFIYCKGVTSNFQYCRYILFTQLEATYARRVFPCFDEPAKKATFSLTVVRPINMTSLSNTRRISSMERGSEWIADSYETSLKMSTYLLAVVICEYEYMEDSSSSGAIIRVWTQPDLLSQSKYSLKIAPPLLNYFEEFFNFSYSPPKLDLVQIPDFQLSGMENWGLITLHDNTILYDSIRSPVKDQQFLALIISHEISHQWFGNLVTMKWWNDLWLKEGFANYMMYLGVEAVEPTWKIIDQFSTTTLHRAMEMDSWNGTHPVSLSSSSSVDDIDTIASQYDDISYSKGASLIRMMDHVLSREIFQVGIQSYLQNMQYSTATVDDLWNYLNIAAKNCSDLNDTDIKVVMDSWTLQNGYPVVTLTRNYNLQSANLTQMRFSLNKEMQNDGTQWHIPITFTTGDAQNFNDSFARKWLKPKNSRRTLNYSVTIDGMPSPEVWIIVNVQRTGFYRVNYDTYNWNLLIQQLKSDFKQIYVVNRAQLLDDILNLARAGYQNYHLALSASKYLKKETEYLPWHLAFVATDYIDSMLRYTHLHAKWKNYMQDLLKNIYTKLTFFEYNEDHHSRKLLRTDVIKQACYYEEKDCIDNAVKVFNLWMESNGTAAIAGNIIETTVCATVRYGLIHQWEFAWQQFLTSNQTPQKNAILKGLGCTRDPWLLTRLLNRCLNGKYGITSHMARALIFNVGQYNSLSQYLKSFINQDEKPGVAARSYTLAIERVEANMQWLKTNLEPIGMWLNKNIL